ncbi:hypothetical protein XELAEV_18007925mg [Xenopus laevis]|uniref:Uncharacterized protein n=1 Tax=Xenopus laevis TaxID=8355 RepID=A0A974E227_XENLA|nr:hypothetical protein XELAEV_18007925mg [Xenopus laevis]
MSNMCVSHLPYNKFSSICTYQAAIEYVNSHCCICVLFYVLLMFVFSIHSFHVCHFFVFFLKKSSTLPRHSFYSNVPHVTSSVKSNYTLIRGSLTSTDKWISCISPLNASYGNNGMALYMCRYCLLLSCTTGGL